MKVKQFVAKTCNIFPAISKLCFSIVLNRRIKVVKKYLEESDYAFLFFTDSHWGVNAKHSPKMIKEITRRLGIKNVFFGGDIVTHFDSSKEKQKNYSMIL